MQDKNNKCWWVFGSLSSICNKELITPPVPCFYHNYTRSCHTRAVFYIYKKTTFYPDGFSQSKMNKIIQKKFLESFFYKNCFKRPKIYFYGNSFKYTGCFIYLCTNVLFDYSKTINNTLTPLYNLTTRPSRTVIFQIPAL